MANSVRNPAGNFSGTCGGDWELRAGPANGGQGAAAIVIARTHCADGQLSGCRNALVAFVGFANAAGMGRGGRRERERKEISGEREYD